MVMVEMATFIQGALGAGAPGSKIQSKQNIVIGNGLKSVIIKTITSQLPY